jgi:hypothetical protein
MPPFECQESLPYLDERIRVGGHIDVERNTKVVHEVLAKTFVLVLIEGVSLTYKGARVNPNKTNKSG